MDSMTGIWSLSLTAGLIYHTGSRDVGRTAEVCRWVATRDQIDGIQMRKRK
jgi:hypothetical protein